MPSCLSKSKKQPRDLNQLAVGIVGAATEDKPRAAPAAPEKDPLAVELGGAEGLRAALLVLPS